MPSFRITKGKGVIDNNEAQIYYIFGKLEAQLETAATSSNISFAFLAQRLADLLQLSAHRQLLGTVNNMSALRRKTSNRRKRGKKMALARRSYGKTQLKEYKRMWHRAHNGKDEEQKQQAIEWLKKFRERKVA